MPHEMPASCVYLSHREGVVRPMRQNFHCGIEDDIVRFCRRLLRLATTLFRRVGVAPTGNAICHGAHPCGHCQSAFAFGDSPEDELADLDILLWPQG
jgi:hypothetical protein